MEYSQEELNRAWNVLKTDNTGKYYPARIIVDDKSENVILIPTKYNGNLVIYRRRPGEYWDLVPDVGEQREFEGILESPYELLKKFYDGVKLAPPQLSILAKSGFIQWNVFGEFVLTDVARHELKNPLHKYGID